MHHSAHRLNCTKLKSSKDMQRHAVTNYVQKLNTKQIGLLTPLQESGMAVDFVCSNPSGCHGGLEWLKTIDNSWLDHL